MSSPCPPAEQLLAEATEGHGPALEHSRECASCAAVLEEHRQLEFDLLRLADPPPPPDFVNRVMAKVAEAPVPARAEARTGTAVLAASLGLCAVSFVVGGAGFGELGTSAARLAVDFNTLWVGVGSGVVAVWHTAALPATLAAVLAMGFSLVGLRRLAETKVSR